MNSPQLLSDSYETALEVLNAVVKRGFELRKIVRIGSIRETPTNSNVLKQQKIELQNWIEDSYQQLDRLFFEKCHIEGLRKYRIDEDLFNIAPEDQENTGIFSPRRRAATHLAEIIEGKTDDLLALLNYVELYGKDQRILALRMLSEATLGSLNRLLSKNAFEISENLDRYYEGIFDKIKDEQKDLFTALKERMQETEKNPVRPTVIPGAASLGKDGYFATIDDIRALVTEYESAFIRIIGLQPSLLLDDWNLKPPKYDYTGKSRCYEELGDYVAQLIVNLKTLTYKVREYLDRSQLPNQPVAVSEKVGQGHREVGEPDDLTEPRPESIGAENVIMSSSTGFVIRYQGGDDIPFGDLDGLFYIWACLDHPMKSISERELTEKRIGRSQDQSESRTPDAVKPYEKEYLENISGGGVIDPEGIQKTIRTYTTAIVNMEADKERALEENNNVEADSLERDIKWIKAERAKLRNKYDRPISDIDDPDDSRRIIYAALDYAYKKMESNQPELAAHLRKHLIRERGLRYTGNLEWETR